MRVLPRLFKLRPWVNLDPFYAKVKLGHIGFGMGKSENYYFFWDVLQPKVSSCLKNSTKWVNEVESVCQRSRPFFDLGQRSFRFQI